VYNFSQGGMTAKTYIENFSERKGYWEKDKLAQAYIIALGVNDVTRHLKGEIELGSMADIDVSDYHNNAKSFIGYYAQIIQRIKEIQPRAKIFLISPPQNGNEQDERTQKYRIVRDLLQQLTALFDRTYLLDMFEYAPKQDKEFSNTFWLGHMTPTGYVLAARMIESYIDYVIRKNPKDFKQVGFIGTDLYYEEE
jgi:lysophospholipase L1-like esterase